jgi:hypothetical protein
MRPDLPHWLKNIPKMKHHQFQKNLNDFGNQAQGQKTLKHTLQWPTCTASQRRRRPNPDSLAQEDKHKI